MKGYGVLSSAKNIGNNVSKNISKNLSGKYSQKLLDHTKNLLQTLLIMFQKK